MAEYKEEIREAKVCGDGGPHLFCPYCRKRYDGWALEQEHGETDVCDKCGRKFKIV